MAKRDLAAELLRELGQDRTQYHSGEELSVRLGVSRTAVWKAACRLREQGVQVDMFDTSVTPASYILAAAFRFSHVVLAAPTYNGGVFVTMENLLHDLTAHGLKGRRAAYIENGSWAPTSARGMQKLLEPLGWEQAADTVTLRSALRQGQQEDLERMAAQLAESVKA